MSNSISILEAAQRLLAADDIAILTHARPDGDTLGSASALCAALRQIGKTAFVWRNGEASPKLLPFAEKYFSGGDFSPKFVCSVDVAGEHLLPADARERFAGAVDLAIDHHGTNAFFARESCVDAHAAACAEVIISLVHALGAELTVDVATPAYLGLSTDTGCFKYSSVRAETHIAAAACIAAGVDHYAIDRAFWELQTRARIAVENAILGSAKYYKNGAVAVGVLTLNDLKNANATEDDSEGISSILRRIEGVELGALLREYEGEWRVSMRCAPELDVAAICARLGGGGHRFAAGATLKTSYDEAFSLVLDAIKAELGEL